MKRKRFFQCLRIAIQVLCLLLALAVLLWLYMDLFKGIIDPVVTP